MSRSFPLHGLRAAPGLQDLFGGRSWCRVWQTFQDRKKPRQRWRGFAVSGGSRGHLRVAARDKGMIMLPGGDATSLRLIRTFRSSGPGSRSSAQDSFLLFRAVLSLKVSVLPAGAYTEGA